MVYDKSTTNENNGPGLLDRRMLATQSVRLCLQQIGCNPECVAWLDDDTPANVALRRHVNVSLNRPPDRTWRRPPGRPRNKWLDQLRRRFHPSHWRPLEAVDTVVQRHDGFRRLNNHDDDDDDAHNIGTKFNSHPCASPSTFSRTVSPVRRSGAAASRRTPERPGGPRGGPAGGRSRRRPGARRCPGNRRP